MSDPIKRYVNENREAFDRLEPSPEILKRIKNELSDRKIVPIQDRKKPTALWWYVAASVLLLAASTTIYHSLKHEDPIPELVKNVHETPTSINDVKARNIEDSVSAKRIISETTGNRMGKKHHFPDVNNRVYDKRVPAVNEELDNIFIALADSTSASTRLDGILKLGGMGKLTDALIDTVESKLKHDPSVNVRIAALELLIRHRDDPYVADKIVYSITDQDDPIMQLSLINIVAHIDSTSIPMDDIREKIAALASNPLTIAAVKDEAEVFLFNNQQF